MKKLTSILLAVLMLTSVFVSCVGDNNTTTTDIPTTEAPTTEAPTTEAPTTEAPTTNPSGEYNITYELNGGTNSRFNPDTYKTGEFVYLSSPEKENYVFADWYTDPEFTNKTDGYIDKDIEGDLTLYAKWNDIYGSFVMELEGDSYTIQKYYYNENTEFEGIPASYKEKPITKIGNHAFGDCLNITSVVIPDSITHIGEGAFKRCSNIEEITIPDSVTHIGSGAFYRCSKLEEIIIPDSVTYIGVRAFSSCDHLTSITIPDSVTYIGVGAFEECRRLTDAVILCNTETMFGRIFTDCSSLEKITFGPDVSYADGIHGNYQNLSEISVSEENNYFRSIDGALYSKDRKTLIYFPVALNISTFEIPEGVTEISDNAFYGAKFVKEIKITKTLKNINENTFSMCDSIEGFTVDGENADFKSIDGVLFSKDGTKLIRYPVAKKVSSYTIPNGVNSIEKHAFDRCSTLKSITIPKTVNKIGAFAFRRCTNLESIEIPDGVTKLEGETFSSCSALRTVTLPDSIKTFGEGEFQNCTKLVSIKLPDGLTAMGESAFFNCKALKSINIPEGLTKIENYAFHSCSSLQKIELHSGIKSIGEYAFTGCQKMQIATLGDVTVIKEAAFANCTNLTLYCEADAMPENWYKELPEDVKAIVWGAERSDAS
ncbi:MAG: leucine-rich repeat protein [Clostridia bacterium]|nr:leucine-rich repeat protein [Clostridia bacterium]